ncbi:CoA pyrophosphatase [Marinivivus vitaminiproducens]|uniref:CoA pyrophosphatase n=1 Tax=Marinivivus vitaminiproducens TaxID=3035935 RepID=UPI00279AD433|nr:CoA pyrophosphatase [Geminicoccaceae bacterium SCSIO 64248]
MSVPPAGRHESMRARIQRALDGQTRAGPPGGWLNGDEGAALLDREPGRTRTPAAVLLGLIDHPAPDVTTVLLTQRTAHLRDHAGQVAFPGGRVEPEDKGPVDTALREAEEEVGLPPDRVEILGFLPPYDTVTGFRIQPVVGWVRPPEGFRPQPFEVADVFEVPLGFVLDPANHQRRRGMRNGRERTFYVLPYENRYIWGATAGMLVNFARLVGAA